MMNTFEVGKISQNSFIKKYNITIAILEEFKWMPFILHDFARSPLKFAEYLIR